MSDRTTRRRILEIGVASGAAAVGAGAMALQQSGMVSAQEAGTPRHVQALASQSSKIEEVLSRGHLIVGTGS